MVDSSTEGFALEATGDPEKLDEFIDVMRSYGEIEVTRSGAVAVSLEAKKLQLAAAGSDRRRGQQPANSKLNLRRLKCQNAITKKTETSTT